jgi:ribonucleoside-diphosphate reductase alpha chain
MSEDPFANPVARQVWESRYRFRDDRRIHDMTIEDTWRRIARALSAVEPRDRARWEERFYGILESFRFLPGGRIQAGAGTGRNVTLLNCFVMGVIEDSIPGIFGALEEGAITMHQGGGVGYDFSTLRPRGMPAKGVGAIASGPVSFMQVWDAMCATILATGARRGAMMATLRCDHPDIEAFVAAKQASGQLRHFNLSVQVTDAFVEAVRADRDWALVFPAEDGEGETVLRPWPAQPGPVSCRVHRRVRAAGLWDAILAATYDHAEPGVLFIDRINRLNNLWYREHISATNPCGEIPLPPYGACDLGSINLTRFVQAPFTSSARIDLEALRASVPVAVRLLDDVIDASRFALPAQAEAARGTRRIGLGVTGLADALIMLGLDYDSGSTRELAARVIGEICHGAYRASIELAREKGAFPYLDRERYLEGPFVAALPDDIRDGIARHGIRNSHLLAIAPTGTISLLAGNVSSGIEPVYDAEMTRRVLDQDGRACSLEVVDLAVRLWREGGRRGLPPAFVRANDLSPLAHLSMQAALQPFVDNAISKTINVPEAFPFEDFRRVYDLAFDLGLKGCTTFRPNPVTGAVLEAVDPREAPHCCLPEREAD